MSSASIIAYKKLPRTAIFGIYALRLRNHLVSRAEGAGTVLSLGALFFCNLHRWRSCARNEKRELKSNIIERHHNTIWFSRDAEWFVLFVQSRKELEIAERLQRGLTPNRYKVFVPTRPYAKVRSGGMTEIQKIPWLSGYVFIATTDTPIECKKMVESLMINDSTVFKFLTKSGEREIAALSVEDRALMAAILDDEFSIHPIPAEVVADRIKIANNILERNGGRVTKVDKHRQFALVQMRIMDRDFKCEIALEFI